MKGLLLKDWYMMKKYCKSYIFIAVVFIAISLLNNGNDGNIFFMFYPCLLCGIIPVNLLGYDERSRWIQYSGCLPYTKTQIVSAKYLIGLFAQVAMLIVTGLAQGIKMSINGNFAPNDFIVIMLFMLTIATLTSSISLPFIFKLGVEKGRFAYYVMVCFIFSAGFLVITLFKEHLQVEIRANTILPVLSLAGICVYILSWCMSIVFYKKREIQ